MAVTLGTQFPQAPGTFQTSETFTGSTATAFRNLDNNTEISFLGMGTATGDNSNNLYALNATTTASGREGDGVEGAWKMIMSTGTGEAAVFVQMPTQGRLPLDAMLQITPAATGNIDVTMASATGNWVFSSDGDFLLLRFINGRWNYISGAGATMATAT